MRRARRPLAFFILAVSVLAAAVPGAGSTPPAAVRIMTSQTCPSPEASFQATGAIDDSGTVVSTPLLPSAGPFGVTGSMERFESVFVGANGTFTVLWNVTFLVTDDPDVIAEYGTWLLIGGTGDYAGLNGQGTSRGTCDFEGGAELNTLTGRVH